MILRLALCLIGLLALHSNATKLSPCLKKAIQTQTHLEFQIYNPKTKTMKVIQRPLSFGTFISYKKNGMSFSAIGSKNFFLVQNNQYNFISIPFGNPVSYPACPIYDYWEVELLGRSSDQKYFYYRECEVGGCHRVTFFDVERKKVTNTRYGASVDIDLAIHFDSGIMVASDFRNLEDTGSGEALSKEEIKEIRKKYAETEYILWANALTTQNSEILARQKGGRFEPKWNGSQLQYKLNGKKTTKSLSEVKKLLKL